VPDIQETAVFLRDWQVA